MGQNKRDIHVYAHWTGLDRADEIGTLSAHQGKGKKAFSFEYRRQWLKSRSQMLLDPHIQWYEGPQYPLNKENFGVFLDSMPDTWGRTLMKRKEGIRAREVGEKPRKLYDIDFLLGVYDESRMGALRFKREPDGPFLDDDAKQSIPPWSSIREIQYAASQIEVNDPDEEKKWMNLLFAHASSLGGARPKANVLDEKGELWIAKFPSMNDRFDKAAWEFLAYQLALKAGIEMAECKLEKIAGKFHTFLTKRFDRKGKDRIHFSSAMTLTGNDEEILRYRDGSYLEIAEFISFQGSNVTENLHKLWRRLVFNIAVSNTDDHMRNHGFLLTPKGWELSPAYDINPSIDKDHLALTIDLHDSTPNLELARDVGEFFRLNDKEMDQIEAEVFGAVANWKQVAKQIGISRKEILMMEPAFTYSE